MNNLIRSIDLLIRRQKDEGPVVSGSFSKKLQTNGSSLGGGSFFRNTQVRGTGQDGRRAGKKIHLDQGCIQGCIRKASEYIENKDYVNARKYALMALGGDAISLAMNGRVPEFNHIIIDALWVKGLAEMEYHGLSEARRNPKVEAEMLKNSQRSFEAALRLVGQTPEMEMEPDRVAQLCSDLGKACTLSRRYASAETYFMRSLSLREHASTFTRIGIMYVEWARNEEYRIRGGKNALSEADVMERYEKGVDYLNQAIGTGSATAFAYCVRGRGKKGLGDYAGAISDYEESLRLEPNQPDVRGLLRACKIEMGDSDVLADHLPKWSHMPVPERH